MGHRVQRGLDATQLASSPNNPPAGRRLLFPKSDGWYERDTAGAETRLAGTTDLGAYSLTTHGHNYIPTNLLTTKGDVISQGGGGAATRVPIGTDGQVLTADSAQTVGLKWATPTAYLDQTEVDNRVTAVAPTVTMTTGSVGTGAFRDSVRAALNGAYAEAWTTYTPSFTASTTNPTLGNFTRTGRYIQRGKTVEFMIVITCNSATGLGVGTYVFGLPVTARAAAEVVVQANQEVPNHNYLGRSGDATTVQLYLTSTDVVMSNTSSGMQSGTKIRISGTYEAA